MRSRGLRAWRIRPRPQRVRSTFSYERNSNILGARGLWAVLSARRCLAQGDEPRTRFFFGQVRPVKWLHERGD